MDNKHDVNSFHMQQDLLRRKITEELLIKSGARRGHKTGSFIMPLSKEQERP